MNTYYYIIEIYVKGQLHLIVEKDDFTQITEFVEKTKAHRCDKFYDCKVSILVAQKCGQRTGIDNFSARCTDFIKLMAMEV